MVGKKRLKMHIIKTIFGCFFAVIGLFAGLFGTGFNQPVYAVEEQTTTTEVQVDETTAGETTEAEENQPLTDKELNELNKKKTKNCKKSLGEIGWLVCPATGKIAEAVDWLYDKIEDILVINPISTEDDSPVYQIWKVALSITNVLFIVFLLVVIYSQITGLGINNYGIKKILPKLIIAAILVNLSFLICLGLIDLSNIIGGVLRGLFSSIGEAALPATEMVYTASGDYTREMKLSYANMYSDLAGGASIAIAGGVIAFETGSIWMLIPVLLGALVSVITGLITIALRQAVVILLIMISPLAIMAYILPNTESLYKKWWALLKQMLVFYPMFSLLFGASNLAGYAIITSAKDGFGLLLGMAVQIFPLFYAWKMMKMSGTFLSTINAKLNGYMAGPLALNASWAMSRKQQTNAQSLQYGSSPFAHLRRYLDDRKTLREEHTKSLETTRKGEAMVYTQRMIAAGYDGTKAQGTKAYLKPNKYTKAAKDASNANLASQTATADTTHVISNYEDYYVDKEVRRKVNKARKAQDEEALRRLERSDAEYHRAATGGRNFLEYSRAQITAEHDSEADLKFMVGEYIRAAENHDPNVEEEFSKYKHYILSSAGGLGTKGQARVLGKIIAKAAAVESAQRRDINILASKYPPDKRNYRNFMFNYYIDDDGFATDKNGERIENIRDYLRVNAPDKLVQWDHYDENGPYFDWYDTDGKYVTRIYKSDASSIKELMSNFDTPINDPINNMFAIHSGIKEQPNSDIPVLRHMGLERYRTTIGRALQNAPFKEKNAMFSPMVAEMVKKGYIKNYAHLNLAYLDSFNKATKPGGFNQQDADAIELFAMMMDPDKWDLMFPTELIRDRLNVNGEEIYGIRHLANGETVKVDASEATREELMERVLDKFIIPAAKKATVMMSRQTPNTIDNQKPGTVEAWKKLKEVFDTKWGDKKRVPEDPYKQKGDMRAITSDIQRSLYTLDEHGNKVSYLGRKKGQTTSNGTINNGHNAHVNHHAETFDIYNYALTADDFATRFSEYCSNYPELGWVSEQFEDYVVSSGYSVTKDQLYSYALSLLDYVDYDD